MFIAAVVTGTIAGALLGLDLVTGQVIGWTGIEGTYRAADEIAPTLGSIVYVHDNTGRVVARTEVGADGGYQLVVGPGRYSVTAGTLGCDPPIPAATQVVVVPGFHVKHHLDARSLISCGITQ
jgi:hypothetical protein